MTCAVLAALKKRGADPCAFKSGPDYIDPMFHRSALQVDSHNLDLFLLGPAHGTGTLRPLRCRAMALPCAREPWAFTTGRA